MSNQNKPKHLTGKKLALLLSTPGFLGTVPITTFDHKLSAEIGAMRTKITIHNNITGMKYGRPLSFDILGALGEWVLQSMLVRSHCKEADLGALLAAGPIKGKDFGFNYLDFDVKGMKADCTELRVNESHHITCGNKLDFYLYFKLSDCGTYASLYNIPSYYVSAWKVKPGITGAPFHAKNLTKMLAQIKTDQPTEYDMDYPSGHDFTDDATFLARKAEQRATAH